MQSAIAFGVTAFSGAACVIPAMQIPGRLMERVWQVLKVYSIVAVGAVAISLFRPLFESLLPATLHLFTSVFLIGLGLSISRVAPLQRVARWLGFGALLKGMLAASLLNGLIHGITWQASGGDSQTTLGVAVAVIAGCSLSLLGTSIASLIRHDGLKRRPLDLGAGVSLVAMGFRVLGLAVPEMVVVSSLAVGLVWTFGPAVWRAWRVRGVSRRGEGRVGVGDAMQT